MMDWLTKALGRYIDIVFVDNPIGTSMGALGGAILVLLTRLLAPLLRRMTVIDVLAPHPILYICLGIFSANLKRFIRGDSLPAALEARLRLIRDELRAKRISKREAQALYKELLEEAVAEVVRQRAPRDRSAA